jgi:hypothetical protein
VIQKNGEDPSADRVAGEIDARRVLGIGRFLQCDAEELAW